MPQRKTDIPSPIGGYDEGNTHGGQKRGTTPDCLNVMPHDPAEDRVRVAQRPGTALHNSAQVNGTNPIQCITQATFALGPGFPGSTFTTQVSDSFNGYGADAELQSDNSWDEADGTDTTFINHGYDVCPSAGNNYTITDGTAQTGLNVATDTASTEGEFRQTSEKAQINVTTTDVTHRSWLLANTYQSWGLDTTEYRVKVKLTTLDGDSDDASLDEGQDVYIGGIAFRILAASATDVTAVNGNGINEFMLFGWLRPSAPPNDDTPQNPVLGVWEFSENASGGLDFALKSTAHILPDNGDSSEHQMELRVEENSVTCFWDDVEIFTNVNVGSDYQSTNACAGIYAAHIKASAYSKSTKHCKFDDFQFFDEVSAVLDDFDGISNGTKLKSQANWEEYSTAADLTGVAQAGALDAVMPNAGESGSEWSKATGASLAVVTDTIATSGGFEYLSNKITIVDANTDEGIGYSYCAVHATAYPGSGTTEEYAIKAKLTPADITTASTYDNDAMLSGIAFRIDNDEGDPTGSGGTSYNNMMVYGWYRPPPATVDGGAANAYLGVWEFDNAAGPSQGMIWNTTLGSAPYDTGSTGDTSEHTMEIRVRNNTVWCYWDGELVINGKYLSDTHSTNGYRCGLYHTHIKHDESGSSRATLFPTFDDFEISNVEVSDVSVQETQVYVSAGTVKVLSEDNTFNTIISGTSSSTAGLDSSAPVVRAFRYNNRVQLLDGVNYRYFNQTTGTLTDWEGTGSSATTLPGGNGSTGANTASADGQARCTFGCMYVGRAWMGGKADDPQNFFASAKGDIDDWDDGVYTDRTLRNAAIVGNTGPLGRIGDTLTGFWPYYDQSMVMGCAHSVHLMVGDPRYGGYINNVSDKIGIISADAGARGPDGTLYFMGQNGLYFLKPGSDFVDDSNRISGGRLDKTFSTLNPTTHRIQLLWDTFRDGLHIFITPYTQGAAKHWFWDRRTNSFWPQKLPPQSGPTAVHEFSDRNSSNTRVLMGTHEGYILYYSDSAKDDEGGASSDPAIESYCFIGPFMPNHPDEFRHIHTSALLDEDSDGATLKIVTADTPELALRQTPLSIGTLVAGRNNKLRKRARGYAGYYRIGNNTASERWSLEHITAEFAQAGVARSR